MYCLTPASLPEKSDGDFRTRVIADFYRMHVPSLLADAGFCAALNPLQQYQKEHLDRAERGQGKLSGLVSQCRKEQQEPGELLDSLMKFVPFLAAILVKRNTGKGGLELLWTVDTGKTWKSLRDFPRRLRRMADEVERLNKSPFFQPRASDHRQKSRCQFCQDSAHPFARSFEYVCQLDRGLGKQASRIHGRPRSARVWTIRL